MSDLSCIKPIGFFGQYELISVEVNDNHAICKDCDFDYPRYAIMLENHIKRGEEICEGCKRSRVKKEK